MDFKTGLLVITLLAVSYALPAPENLDHFLFRHETPGSRIVGGTMAPPGSHLHMVAMCEGVLIKNFICGGSIINSRTILTAAHCIAAVTHTPSGISNSLRMRVGSHQWNRGGITLTVARGIMHPQYNMNELKNDTGLLITSVKIPLREGSIQIVPINYAPVGGEVPVTLAGWGRIRAGGPFSVNLLEVDLTTITGQECIEAVDRARVELDQRHAPLVDPNAELCTFRAVGHGTCSGDSGSALLVASGQQVGVVSWGFSCALGYPDMFVRLSSYQAFIEANSV